MWKILLLIAAAVLLLLGIFCLRRRCFKPNPDKDEQYRELNETLKKAGFGYCRRADYFYSLHDCWQRQTGYCRLYDENAPLFNMIMDCEPIEFSYGGKRWLVELWKGQYGITTGAEIGIYNTDKTDVTAEAFTGPFYNAVSDSEQIKMSYVLYKNGKRLITRRGYSWWLTAFKLGEFSERKELLMKAKLVFPTEGMLRAFTDALRDIGYGENEFHIGKKSVKITFARPHTKQSLTSVREHTVQSVNRTNTAAYNAATSKYSYTPDKLEFLKSFSPELFDFTVNSLYGKAFYEAFRWLFDKHKKPPKSVKTRKPCKPPVKTCRCACRHVGCSCKEFCRKRCERIQL